MRMDPDAIDPDMEEEEEVIISNKEEAESDLLLSSRNGELEEVKRLLSYRDTGEVSVDINCKGKSKANLGWSPLHLASYFGHKDVVQYLLKNGADVNIVNDIGDTALHRAAYTGRVEVVTLLLENDADVNLINHEGKTATDVARNEDVSRLIKAAASVSQQKLVDEFLKAARNGNVKLLNELLSSGKSRNLLSINCTDSFGNTALHSASYRGRKEVAVFLLQNGIDPSLMNNNGQTALDLASDLQMKQLLDVTPIREIKRNVKRFEGPIFRKYKLRGWRPFWGVLDSGVLTFFRRRADATAGVRRKSFRELRDATIEPLSDNPNLLIVKFPDQSGITLAVSTDDNPLLLRQKWDNAIQDHIGFCNYYSRHTVEVSDDEDLGEIVSVGSMQDALETAAVHQQLLEGQISSLTSNLNALSAEKQHTTISVNLLKSQVSMTQILETSTAMSAALGHCLNLFSQQEELRKLQLAQEAERCRVLQESLHVLAREHHELEQSVGGHTSPNSRMYGHGASESESEDEQDEFYDCDEEDKNQNNFMAFKDSLDEDKVEIDPSVLSKLSESDEQDDINTLIMNNATNGLKWGSFYKKIEPTKWGGRCRLPGRMISRSEVSVWSILKQCIGKELSKITMPVVFNEPTSFLQRIVEYMEYTHLLTKAAQCDDPVKRLEYVSAFAVSATASNWERVSKPFNPLLGETYELNREDLGYRVVTEQVSHHPPVSAFHTEGDNFVFHGAIHPKLKFWGKSVEITPKGYVTLELKKYGEVYTWHNVNCCVHNIIVGKLWIELYGTMEIINHKTKHKAVLSFKPSGWFGKDLHKVEGYIYDKSKKKLRAFYGKWVEALFSYDVKTWETYAKAHNMMDSPLQMVSKDEETKTELGFSEDAVPGKGSTCNLQLDNQVCLWQAHERPEDSEKFYNFTLFAMMLNELKEGQQTDLPNTDSRLRPDMRLMENGDMDGAAAEKHRLEEKQRGVRKERKKNKEEFIPRWFKCATNPYTGKDDWIFTQEYWKRQYQESPDIF